MTEKMTLEKWMGLVNYKITDSSEFGFECFGNNVMFLDSFSGDVDGTSSSVVFSTKTQEFYVSEVHDFCSGLSYRLINPDYLNVYKTAFLNDEDFMNAYDDVNFIDLEVLDDFCEKCSAIVNQEQFDERVKVPVNLPDDVLFELMKAAHEKDITLNEHINDLLTSVMSKNE